MEIFGNLKLASKFDKLRDIDVYNANDVHLNALNPTKSNLPVPFLILYDSDFLVNVNVDSSSLAKLTLSNKKLNLSKIEDSLKCCFYGSSDFYIKKAIKAIYSAIESPKKINNSGTDFSLFKLEFFVNHANRNVFKSRNVRFNYTTIEGVLINDKSLSYFISWLFREFMLGFNISPGKDIDKKVNGVKRGFSNHGDIKIAFKALFSSCDNNIGLSKDLERFSRRIKIGYLKLIRDEIREFELPNHDLVAAFRLVFGGKTNTFQKFGADSYDMVISREVRDFVEKVRSDYLKNFTFDTSKTSGWATSFIDYCIDKLDMETDGDNKRFYAQFAVVFPELDDIIKKVSF